MQTVKRCGAKTRAGHPCGRYAMENGRCRLHGGLSKGRPVTTGQWTKEAIRQRREVAKLIRGMKSTMTDLMC